MHKVLLSYHHGNDEAYKECLVEMSRRYGIFIDMSVDTGDIDDSLSDARIREIIRDEYLRDSTVTIVLVGRDTKHRKHVDWEIYSSMFNGKVNKKSGILVIKLPGTSELGIAPGEQEKEAIYPDIDRQSWISIQSRAEYERQYPNMPARIIDNLVWSEVKISVVPWPRIANYPERVRWLVGAAFKDRAHCRYDLSQPMRRRNS